jgi:hypothetical protein
MRDQITTGMEVAGMILIAIAVGILTSTWVGFGLAGTALLATGVLEGRKK